MIFVEFDSDFSAEEDQFCDPKSFNRHGHQNLSLAVYENLAKKTKAQKRCLPKKIKGRSNFDEIDFEVLHQGADTSDYEVPRYFYYDSNLISIYITEFIDPKVCR